MTAFFFSFTSLGRLSNRAVTASWCPKARNFFSLPAYIKTTSRMGFVKSFIHRLRLQGDEHRNSPSSKCFGKPCSVTFYYLYLSAMPYHRNNSWRIILKPLIYSCPTSRRKKSVLFFILVIPNLHFKIVAILMVCLSGQPF